LEVMTEPAPAPVTVPWRAPQLVCAVGLVAGIIASYALLAATPTLLAHHDLTLEATSGSLVSIVTGGALVSQGREPIFLVLLAPMTSVVLYDVFYWWAGKLWGPPVIAQFVAQTPRRQRQTARAEDLVRRHGVWALIIAYFLPAVPIVVVQAFCGVSGMPLWRFLIGDASALLLRVGALVGLGYAIGEPAVRLATTVSRYGLRVTIGIVLVVMVVTVVRQSRVSSEPPPSTDR
jgi:membrane protein DedA with SNARE-associated domain